MQDRAGRDKGLERALERSRRGPGTRPADEGARHHLREYLATDGRTVHWDLIRAACASVADSAVYPMQDVLGLDGRHRMNFPGKGEGNWAWRFDWAQVPPEAAQRLRRMAQLYERL